MKNILKVLTKKIIIYVVIFMIVLTSITPTVLAGYSVDDVGNAVAGFAKHAVDTYGEPGTKVVKYDMGRRTQNPIWSPDTYKWGDECYFDCSAFASGCYKYVTGLLGDNSGLPYCTSELYNGTTDLNGNFEKKQWDGNVSSLKNGDLMFWHHGNRSKWTCLDIFRK